MKSDLLTSAYLRIGTRLRSIAGRLLGDDDADDALQDAFVRLWSRCDMIQSDNHAEGLLISTVRNLSIDRLRRYSRYSASETGEMTSDDTVDDTEDDIYDEVSTLIDNILSERDRTILYQRDRDEWEYEEIAEYHSISVVNVRAIISRSRRIIREQFNMRAHGNKQI